MKIIITIGAVALVLMLIAGYFVFQNYQKGADHTSQEEPASINKVPYVIDKNFSYIDAGIKIKATPLADTKAVLELTNSYRNYNTEAFRDVYGTPPESWTKKDVEKVHFSLLYANLIGDYNQVKLAVALIAAAKSQSVDVDANGMGVTGADREAMAKVAQERLLGTGANRP